MRHTRTPRLARLHLSFQTRSSRVPMAHDKMPRKGLWWWTGTTDYVKESEIRGLSSFQDGKPGRPILQDRVCTRISTSFSSTTAPTTTGAQSTRASWSRRNSPHLGLRCMCVHFEHVEIPTTITTVGSLQRTFGRSISPPLFHSQVSGVHGGLASLGPFGAGGLYGKLHGEQG